MKKWKKKLAVNSEFDKILQSQFAPNPPPYVVN